MIPGMIRRAAIVGNQRGAVMMLALGVMAALLLIAAASSLFTRGDLRLTVNLRDATRAIFLAEAGIEWAHNQLRGADPALYFTPTSTLAGASQSLGGGAFTVDVGARDGAGRRSVSATGSYDGTARSIAATLRRLSLDPVDGSDCVRPGDADGDSVCDAKLGIVSNKSISVRGGSLFDSFHGDTVAYGAGSAKEHGNIATNGDLTLNGSGTVVRGTPYVGRTLAAGTNSVTRAKVLLPTVYLPPLPDYGEVCESHTNRALVDCNPPFGAVTTILAGSPPEQTMTVAGGQTICMLAGSEYCFRQIVVQSGGTLRFVDDPATGQSTLLTVIHLGTPSSGAAFQVSGRLEYGAEMKPNLLKVFTRGDVDIGGWSGAQVFGLFYAPRSAARLNSSGGQTADIYGAVFADQVGLGGGPVRFHADEDARFDNFCVDGTDPVCRPALVIREAWAESRS